MSGIGVMICGHGSRDEAACDEFRHVVDRIAERLPEWPVAMGYLEFARPIIRDGLDSLRARGVDHVLAVPGMLFAAGHVKNDVPSVLNAYAEEHGLRLEMGRDLGIDAKLLSAARDRIDAALQRAESDIGLDETCLVVIGRGTSDSDANGNVAKVARMLWEGIGFAHAEIGYSGVAHPRTEVALERATRLGFRRIVVFPYFLFTGVLVRRIYEAADMVAARHPGDRVPAGALSRRPPAGDRHLRRAHPRHPRRRRQHELQPVQVSHPGAGLRARPGRAAGEPPPPCRGHRHRRRASSPSRARPPSPSWHGHDHHHHPRHAEARQRRRRG